MALGWNKTSNQLKRSALTVMMLPSVTSLVLGWNNTATQRKRLVPTVMMFQSGSSMTWSPLGGNLAGTTLPRNGSF